MKEEQEIYRYNDEICFRKCSLANNPSKSFGDCSKFYRKRTILSLFESKETFYCGQEGFHFYCGKHQSVELEMTKESDKCIFICPKCENNIEIDSFDELLRNCQKKLNIKELANAKYIRLDDWYIPEVKKNVENDSNYWIKADVKTDKEKENIIVLYIGKKGEKEKVQYFIKPEKLQLTSDHKDLDPATIISKIEVTLKDRTIIQKYDDRK